MDLFSVFVGYILGGIVGFLGAALFCGRKINQLQKELESRPPRHFENEIEDPHPHRNHNPNFADEVEQPS